MARDQRAPDDGSQPTRTVNLLVWALLFVSILMIGTEVYLHWGGTPEGDSYQYVRRFRLGLLFLFFGGGACLSYIQRRKRPWMFIAIVVCFAVMSFGLLVSGE